MTPRPAPVIPLRDEVVLLRPDGQPCGTADRVAVHGDDTPLHLAFSLYLLDEDGLLLMTRRALSKRTWPGVWSNSCCGHPRPGEDVAEAVRRRVGEELSLSVHALECAIPDFAYRAVDASGVVEHERCPVYVGRATGVLDPDPAEVMDAAWVAPDQVRAACAAAPFAFSPWSVLQLGRLGPDLLPRGGTRGR